MKKLIAILTAAMMIISLAACSNSGKGNETVINDSSLAESSKAEETTVQATTVEETTVADETSFIEESKKQLIGSWTINGVDDESLIFNEDGTGSYKGIFDKDCSFTYTVSVFHEKFNNGEENLVALMSVSFDTGETEDITFEVRDESSEKLVFHNSDYTSGYSGVFNFDDYIRA